jgi:hypothetical protein
MKPFISLFSIAVLIAALNPIAHSQNVTPTHDLMRKKLDHAQSVLEGISLGDFALIAGNASKLTALSNEGAWRAVDTPEYVEQSAGFRRNVEKLRKAAREENLDAATLAYTKMIFSCVECHKYLRDRKVALAPQPLFPLAPHKQLQASVQ